MHARAYPHPQTQRSCAEDARTRGVVRCNACGHAPTACVRGTSSRAVGRGRPPGLQPSGITHTHTYIYMTHEWKSSGSLRRLPKIGAYLWIASNRKVKELGSRYFSILPPAGLKRCLSANTESSSRSTTQKGVCEKSQYSSRRRGFYLVREFGS